MAEISQFITEDSRSMIQRLTRHQCHKEADARGIQYPAGATKDVMIKLFEAHDIDITQSSILQWQGFSGKGINGDMRQEFYPVTKQPASMRNGANAAAALNEVMAAKDKEDQAFEEARLDVLQRENEQLKRSLEQSQRTNEQLTGAFEERFAALEDNKKPQKEKSKYWDAYHKAQELGLTVERGMKLAHIEEMIANG